MLHHRCSALSSASARTSGNQDVTHSHQWYHMQRDYTLRIVLYARYSTVSSASDRTLSLVIFSMRNSLFGLSAYLTRNNNNNNNNNKLQMGCHPVAVIILHVYKIRNWLLINLSWEGYMGGMLWQLGMLGTISAFLICD